MFGEIIRFGWQRLRDFLTTPNNASIPVLDKQQEFDQSDKGLIWGEAFDSPQKKESK